MYLKKIIIARNTILTAKNSCPWFPIHNTKLLFLSLDNHKQLAMLLMDRRRGFSYFLIVGNKTTLSFVTTQYLRLPVSSLFTIQIQALFPQFQPNLQNFKKRYKLTEKFKIFGVERKEYFSL